MGKKDDDSFMDAFREFERGARDDRKRDQRARKRYNRESERLIRRRQREEAARAKKRRAAQQKAFGTGKKGKKKDKGCAVTALTVGLAVAGAVATWKGIT